MDTTAPVQLRTVCSWCLWRGVVTVIAEGPLDAEGHCSHGICRGCRDGMVAKIDELRSDLRTFQQGGR